MATVEMSPPLPHTLSFLSSILNLPTDHHRHHRPTSSSSTSQHSFTLPPSSYSSSSPISSSSSSSSLSSSSSSTSDSFPNSTNSNRSQSIVAPSSTQQNSTEFIQSILSILKNSDDDDKPDQLKSLLVNSSYLGILPDEELDQLILSLLHQHREDLKPSSFARPSHPPILALNRTCSSPNQRINIKSKFPARSLSPCPSPSTSPLSSNWILGPKTCNPVMFHDSPTGLLSPSSRHLTKPALPVLNLQPPPLEKLNASASEFKPSLCRAVSMFESTTTHQVDSILTAPPGSAHLGSFHGLSSVDTPKSANLLYPSPLHSPRSHPSTPKIPRDPWLKDEENQSSPSLNPPPSTIQPTLYPLEQTLEFHPESTSSLDLFSPFQANGFTSPLPLLDTSTEKNLVEPSCSSALEWGLSPEMAKEIAQFAVWDQVDSDGGQLAPQIIHHPPEEEGNLGSYHMTPFDELCSTFAGTGVTVFQMEEALHHCGMDVSRSMDWLLERHGISFQKVHSEKQLLSFDHPIKRSTSPRHPALNPPHPSSHPSGGGHQAKIPRFSLLQSTPSTQTSQKNTQSGVSHHREELPSFEPNPTHRVCRFYLQGCCLRSDCKFSHDVGKAICRFWLKGHCLKGEGRCDFLHEIPDLESENQAKQEEQKEKKKMTAPKAFTDEFPSIKESLSNRSGQKAPKPSRLRPLILLPDGMIRPSPSLLKLSETYKLKYLEFGSRRKECFDLAKECFKRADGAGVKKWSMDGDEWNKKLAEEGRAMAGAIIAERNRLMKDAVRELVSDRLKKVDEAPDRMHRGKEMGGGICLGVVTNANQKSLSVKERTEVLMDLHGLYPDDGVYYLEKFLVALKTEGFQGLAYVMIGETSESESENHQDGATKAEEDWMEVNKTTRRLEKATKAWLERKKFDWESCPIASRHQPDRLKQAIICIDPLSKV